MIGTLETATPSMFESSSEKIKPNLEKLDRRTTRVIFFAGDVIPDTEKYAMPSRAFGGIYLGRYKTIKPASKKGMLYKCALTPLKAKMKAVNKEMIDPTQRKNWETSYIIENGKRTAIGFEDLVVSAPNSLHKETLPGDEINFILRAAQPLGEGGIVEVTALKGATDAEIEAAQLFFFPNWNEILSNPGLLPETTKQLNAYLRGKLTETDALPDYLQTKYASIGREMLRSLAEFSNWGLKYTKVIENQISNRKTKGQPSRGYSAKAELVLPQIGRVRKDELSDDTQSSTRELVVQMSEDRKQSSAIAAEQLELEKRKLDLEERRIAIEERKAGIGQPPVVETAPPEVAETAIADLPPFNIGDSVKFGELSGTIESKPFGRYKVKFADGSTQMADRFELGATDE